MNIKNMRKSKKFIKIAVVLLIPLMLTGCFNYHDINKVTFATSIIFDVDDLGRTILYLDCIKPYRSTNESSDKGRRMVFKGIGKTSIDALEEVERVSSYPLNYSQVRAYLFTEKAAKEGIGKFIDLINNNSEFQIKPSTFVYYGDVEDLLKTTSSDEEYLGMYLNDLVTKRLFSRVGVQSNINYYLSNRLMGNNTLLLPALALKEDVIDKKIQLDGSSILKDNILVDKLDSDYSLIYDLMMGNVKGGNLQVGNPNSKDGFITLNIVSSSEDSKLVKENDKLILVKNIAIETEVEEIQGNAIVDKSLLDYIKVNEESYINGYVKYLFNKYKEKDIDIFGVEREKEIYYPKIEIKDPLLNCEIQVNTKININGTGVSRNSF